MTIKNLCKRYGDRIVYENFNLEIEDGKITAVLGESGSGKTTLLNCIAGITPYDGEITPVSCSYVFQTPRLVPNLTVLKNLLLIKRDEAEARKALAAVRLTDKENAYPVTLSGGEAQRVSLARALLFGGDMWLLDEPFSSLDLRLRNEISRLFLDVFHGGNATAVFVTHSVDEAIALGDRIIVLKNGEISADFSRNTGDETLRKSIICALTD